MTYFAIAVFFLGTVAAFIYIGNQSQSMSAFFTSVIVLALIALGIAT